VDRAVADLAAQPERRAVSVFVNQRLVSPEATQSHAVTKVLINWQPCRPL